jgi:hypothetical protein
VTIHLLPASVLYRRPFSGFVVGSVSATIDRFLSSRLYRRWTRLGLIVRVSATIHGLFFSVFHRRCFAVSLLSFGYGQRVTHSLSRIGHDSSVFVIPLARQPWPVFLIGGASTSIHPLVLSVLYRRRLTVLRHRSCIGDDILAGPMVSISARIRRPFLSFMHQRRFPGFCSRSCIGLVCIQLHR